MVQAVVVHRAADLIPDHVLAAVLLGHGQRAGAGAGLPPRGGAAADTQPWQQGVRISIRGGNKNSENFSFDCTK